jgi:L-fucose isomerase-like protein
MEKAALKIGLMCGVHPNMPGDDSGLFRNIAESMSSLAEEMEFALSVVHFPLKSEEDAAKAVAQMNEEHVDFSMYFSASLPYGRTALPLLKLNSAIGLWSVPEPTTEGVLQLNSYCGLNMIGSILRNYFDEEDIKYKWFYGMPDTLMFRERFEVTLAALKAVKILERSRIGQIGDLADGFENLYVDERVLSRKFGTYIQSRHTVEDLVRRAESYKIDELEELSVKIQSEGSWKKDRVGSLEFEKFVRLNRAFFDFAEENAYNALAISCWSKFQEVYDIAVCGAMSRLNQNGIVAPCEADVTSAVGMLILNAINGERASLNDMVSLDEADNSLSLWHCGVAPGCWADSGGVSWDAHFNIGEYKGNDWNGRGVVADMRFKQGLVTVFNMQNSFDNLFILSGEIMPEKKGYAGSGGWMNKLKLNDTDVDIKELINTISVCRVNHHYPAAFGNLTAELNEFAFWKDLKVIEKVPYKKYMQKFI